MTETDNLTIMGLLTGFHCYFFFMEIINLKNCREVFESFT